MRRIVALVLVVSMLLPQSVAATTPPPRENVHEESAFTWPWIVKFFGEVALGWVIERGLDYAVSRLWLSHVGEHAASAAAQTAARPGLPAQDRALLQEAASTYRDISNVLRRRNVSDAQVRRQIASLRSDMVGRLRLLNQRLTEIDQRLTRLEQTQQRQWRVLFDQRGTIKTLEDRYVELDARLVRNQAALDAMSGRLAAQERVIADHEIRLGNVEQVVYPDPARFYRHGIYTSFSATYADALALDQDASFGGGASLQANLGKHVGVYAEVSVLPLNASDISGPEGSDIEWVTFPAVVGLAVSLLPPQSPISVQFGGGAGLAYSSLRYYPPDYDPDVANWDERQSVSNLIGAGKVEIGAAPALSTVEPLLTVGYIRFMEPLAYATATESSDAGREMWYVSLGVRIRSKLPGEKLRSGR